MTELSNIIRNTTGRHPQGDGLFLLHGVFLGHDKNVSFEARRQHPCRQCSIPRRPRRRDADPAGGPRRPTPTTARARQSGEIRKLTSLLDVSQALASPANLKSAFHRVLEILERYHGTGRSVIALPARGRPPAASARVDRHPRAARRCAARRHAGAAGLRERPPARRPARQPGAGAGRSAARTTRRRRASGPRDRGRGFDDDDLTYICVPVQQSRQCRGVLEVELRVPKRSQLRPDDEVLRRRRIDAGAGAQDADAARSRSAAPGERERAAARRAARALRLLAHPRHERRDAAGVRAGRAGRAHQHDGADPRRVRHRQGAHRAGDPLQLAARAARRSSR